MESNDAGVCIPVVHMCDRGLSVAEDPRLDVHRSGFGVAYSYIHHPLQAS